MVRAAALAFLCSALAASSASAADTKWPENVQAVTSIKGEAVEVTGDLKDGAVIEDLSWAARSSMACFPATQNEKFRGPHALFSTNLPARSILFVTVIPDDPNLDVSIWGYTVGTNNFRVPPAIQSCVSCEAEHKWDRKKKGKTQDHTRTIRFNAVGNPYNVLIGVSGPKDSTAGAFTLKFDLK
jgi:hypothetical protein